MQPFIWYHWKKVYISFLLLSFSTVLLSQQLRAQDVLWVKPVATGEGINASREIVADKQGNVYVGGIFSGKTTFGTIELVANEQYNIQNYVAKFNSDGIAQWAFQYSNEFVGAGLSIMGVDARGNVYVSGRFTDTLQLDDTIALVQGRNSFLAKYTHEGKREWVHVLSTDRISSISVHESGRVCVGMLYRYPPEDPEKRGGALLMYDASGRLLWEQVLLTRSSFDITAVSTDTLGNVAVIGSFWGDSLAIGDTVLQERLPVQRLNLFTALYSIDGKLQWVTRSDHSLDPKRSPFFNVAIDNQQNIFVVGAYAGTLYINEDSIESHKSKWVSSVLLIKYNTTGRVLWMREYGSLGDNWCYDITTDSDGNIYISGQFTREVVLGKDSLSRMQGSHGFLAKLNTAGEFLWTKGLYNSGLRYETRYAIGLDSHENLWLCGSALDTVIIDNRVITSAPNDMRGFFAKIAKITTSVDEQEKVLSFSSLSLYPQPVSDGVFTIELPFVGKAELVVSDVLGRRVYSQTVQGVAEGTPVRVVLPDVPEGLYVLVLRSATGVVASRTFVVGR